MWSFSINFNAAKLEIRKAQTKRMRTRLGDNFINSYIDHLWKNLPKFHKGTTRLGNKEGRAPVTVCNQIIEVIL
jgi:hypothetical protein